jgi:phage replication-related protein YjqB (UPF0714/DUF867 family)
MATRDGTVKKSRAEQKDLQKDKEHCSADANALDALGITVCQQVRVKRDNGKYALYTVSELRHETTDDDDVVRMGLTGRKRLLKHDEADDDFPAEFDSQVVNLTMSDGDAALNGEFIERVRDDRTHTGLIVLAPHGGEIEDHTDDQATRVADQLAGKPVSLWLCKGYGPLSSATNASQIWHITAADIHPGSFPGLNSVFSRRFRDAVAFHGLADDADGDDAAVVLVGGGMASRDLQTHIVCAIIQRVGSDVSVRVAGPGDRFNGDDGCNIVNRLTIGGQNGVQIEQSLSARTAHGDDIAEAVADVYRSLP